MTNAAATSETVMATSSKAITGTILTDSTSIYDQVHVKNKILGSEINLDIKNLDEESLDGNINKNIKNKSKNESNGSSAGRNKGRHSDNSRVSEENPTIVPPSISPSTITSTAKVESGFDFSTKYNIVLLIITCLPFAITIYLGHYGSKALGPWIVVSVCHFLYVGYTYRGAPEITGCREIQVVHRDGPIVRYIGETVRRYFNGSIIKECDLDPKGSNNNLHCTLLYSTLLYSTLLYCTLHYYTVLYSTLHYSTILNSTLLYYTVLYSTILYSTLSANT